MDSVENGLQRDCGGGVRRPVVAGCQESLLRRESGKAQYSNGVVGCFLDRGAVKDASEVFVLCKLEE